MGKNSNVKSTETEAWLKSGSDYSLSESGIWEWDSHKIRAIQQWIFFAVWDISKALSYRPIEVVF